MRRRPNFSWCFVKDTFLPPSAVSALLRIRPDQTTPELQRIDPWLGPWFDRSARLAKQAQPLLFSRSSALQCGLQYWLQPSSYESYSLITLQQNLHHKTRKVSLIVWYFKRNVWLNISHLINETTFTQKSYLISVNHSNWSLKVSMLELKIRHFFSKKKL